MVVEHVEGRNIGTVMLYALSTCVWCKMTKKLLTELGIDYSYTFVDLLQGADQDKVMEEVRKYNPSGSFPMVIINGNAIVGFQEEKIRAAIK
jgi:glutaredoxin-like protein NrdH